MFKKFSLLILLIILGFSSFYVINKNNQPEEKPETKPKLSYVALGDSVAAGAGLSEPSDASACERSNQSYPSLLAKTNNYKLTNLACSGAKLTGGILDSQTVNELALGSQIDRLFNITKKPNLITITIGANDANWTEVLRKCYLSECGSQQDQAVIEESLQLVSINLEATLDKINKNYDDTPPEIYVTGYYQIFSEMASSDCRELKSLTANDLVQARLLLDSLSQTIHSVVDRFNYVKFVPINFEGHELCSDEPWIQALDDKASFHPTLAGQKAIAEQINSAITER